MNARMGTLALTFVAMALYGTEASASAGRPPPTGMNGPHLTGRTDRTPAVDRGTSEAPKAVVLPDGSRIVVK